jgi:hypothetical protein
MGSLFPLHVDSLLLLLLLLLLMVGSIRGAAESLNLAMFGIGGHGDRAVFALSSP